MALDPVAYAEQLLDGNERITFTREGFTRMIQDVSLMSRTDEALESVTIAGEAGALNLAEKFMERALGYSRAARVELLSRADEGKKGP